MIDLRDPAHLERLRQALANPRDFAMPASAMNEIPEEQVDLQTRAVLAAFAPAPVIICPVCRRASFHPEDIRQGYCGNCHAFTSLPRH